MFSANVQGYPSTVQLSGVDTPSKSCKILFHSFGVQSECQLKDLCPYDKIPTYDKSKLRILNCKHFIEAPSDIHVDDEHLCVPEDGIITNNVGSIKLEAPQMNRTKMVNVTNKKNEYKSKTYSKGNSKLSKVKKIIKMVVSKKSKKDISISEDLCVSEGGTQINNVGNIKLEAPMTRTKMANVIKTKNEYTSRVYSKGNSKLSKEKKVKKMVVPKKSKKDISISKGKNVITEASLKKSNKTKKANLIKKKCIHKSKSEGNSKLSKEKKVKKMVVPKKSEKDISISKGKNVVTEASLKKSNRTKKANLIKKKCIHKSKSKGNSKLSEVKKVSVPKMSRKGNSISKRKNIDTKLKALFKKSNKLNISEYLKILENQPVVLLERLKNCEIKAAILNAKKNTKNTNQNVSVNKQRFKSTFKHSEIESVLEVNDVSTDNDKPAKTVQKVKDSLTLNSELGSSNSSNICQVSKFGRKIKSNKYFGCEEVSKVQKCFRLNQENSKTLEKQNFKTKDKNSNLKNKNSLKSRGLGSVPYINKSRAKKRINLINENHKSQVLLHGNNVDDMANECGMKVQIPSQVNVTVESLICTELKLLDYIYKLRSSLQIDCFNYEAALESLDHISNLEITTHMLMKNEVVMDTITKVSKYSGDTKELGISEDDINVYFKKAFIIRHKAQIILNKCVLLFTIPDSNLLRIF